MLTCWLALVAAAFAVGVTLTVVAVTRHRVKLYRNYFEPLPELEAPRRVGGFPRRPAHVDLVLKPAFHDGEVEGWIARPD